MAFLPFVHPDDITDPLVKEDIEQRIARNKGGQEPISLRANHPWFVRWWQEGKRKFRDEGTEVQNLFERMATPMRKYTDDQKEMAWQVLGAVKNLEELRGMQTLWGDSLDENERARLKRIADYKKL